jgi:hypothetical protein
VVEKVGLFSENGSWDPLGTLPLVVQNGEELQTYFLGEVVEKAALFSGSDSRDPLGTTDFGQKNITRAQCWATRWKRLSGICCM